MIKDSLGDRMKNYYESVPRIHLVRRMPVAIRLDGAHFHSFTRGFKCPFDDILVASIQRTMKSLCENIQGVVLGYCQSDEITLILLDYMTLDTQAWFDYEVQKMVSTSASLATLYFNSHFRSEVMRFTSQYMDFDTTYTEEETNYIMAIETAMNKGATFDSRCFNIPKEEVTNLIYWRQLDAIRNSILMVGQANYSPKELLNKSCNEVKEMLLKEKGINWDELPTHLQRGSCYIRKPEPVQIITKEQEFGDPIELCQQIWKWEIDTEIPIFKGDDREYIEKLIYIGEE